MCWLLTWFITTLASLVVGELLAPRQEINNAKALGAGDFKFPTADPSRCIPLLLGKGILQAPNVVWYGDFAKVPIRKRAGKGGFLGMGRTKWQTVNTSV